MPNIKRPAPYRHADGSDCYTRDCSRGGHTVVADDFNTFLARQVTVVPQLDGETRSYIWQQMAFDLWGEYADQVMTLIEQSTATYGQPEVGRTRAVFNLGNGQVMKIAFTGEGIGASAHEARVAKETDPYTPVAKCEWAQRGQVDVLLMEWVEPLEKIDYKALPDWVMSVDCAQVGYTFDGRLVAYDL